VAFFRYFSHNLGFLPIPNPSLIQKGRESYLTISCKYKTGILPENITLLTSPFCIRGIQGVNASCVNNFHYTVIKLTHIFLIYKSLNFQSKKSPLKKEIQSFRLSKIAGFIFPCFWPSCKHRSMYDFLPSLLIKKILDGFNCFNLRA